MIAQRLDQAFASTADLAERYPRCPAGHSSSCTTLLQFVEDRAGHDFRYALQPSEALQQLGFEPQVLFNEGLDETLDWYLDNEHWWRQAAIE